MSFNYQYIIIGVVLIFILLIVLKANKKDFYIEANKLVEYLGGKDNILNMEVNMSRFKVTLKDVSKCNKEGNVVGRYSPTFKPEDMEKDIINLL